MKNFASLTKFKLNKNLRDTGFTKQQADLLANTISIKNELNSNLTDKRDFEKIRYEISLVREEIAKLELRMIIKLGSLLCMALSIITMINSKISG